MFENEKIIICFIFNMQRGSFPIMIFDGIGGSFESLIFTFGVCISKVCCSDVRMPLDSTIH